MVWGAPLAEWVSTLMGFKLSFTLIILAGGVECGERLWMTTVPPLGGVGVFLFIGGVGVFLLMGGVGVFRFIGGVGVFLVTKLVDVVLLLAANVTEAVILLMICDMVVDDTGILTVP